MYKIITLAIIVAVSSACSSGQKIANTEQSPLILMSLDEMFPEQKIRDLAKAAGEGKSKRIVDLVDSGLDVNAGGVRGVPALFWALRSLNKLGYEKLLSLGANPNLIFDDQTVIHWAARLEDSEFLNLSLKYGGNPNLAAGESNETPIFNTININDGRNLRSNRQLLLNAGADINHKNDSYTFGIDIGGVTPLYRAATIVRIDIVNELLSLGAQCDVRTHNGDNIYSVLSEFRGRFDDSKLGRRNAHELENVLSWLEVNCPQIVSNVPA